MPDSTELARAWLAALSAPDPAAWAACLRDDAGLRVWNCEGLAGLRPRARVVAWFEAEQAGWPDMRLEGFTFTAAEDRVAVEFRIQATEDGRYVEHNRAAVLTIADGAIAMIDLYCPAPVPSARRHGWIAPASLDDAELEAVLASADNRWDMREWLPPQANFRGGLRGGRGGSGDPHPGSNGVGGARWTDAEADDRIAALIAEHRDRGIGFQWFVGPHDTPTDLPARLERHGLVRAGDMAIMARRDLSDLAPIPVNPAVTIEVLDGSDTAAVDAAQAIIGAGFNWTEAQIAERRPFFHERIRRAAENGDEILYLARLDGTPVAEAALTLRGGVAYLAGAATLPAYRGQHVYSTLLHRRLADAHARGYGIATIDAEPMSKRVVTRYGFREYHKTLIYAWMPVIDMAVIRSLVPDE
ncbi:MAG TPA: GNAT family N-acetyltransferase [Chloroflexia bacterium]|nr:GNAT family N-acetyltransferase [Chloroflexia bacterium]